MEKHLHSRVSPEQLAVVEEWEKFTGFEFMWDDENNTFKEAVAWNRRWLEEWAGDANAHLDKLETQFFAEEMAQLAEQEGQSCATNTGEEG